VPKAWSEQVERMTVSGPRVTARRARAMTPAV
jgi:hypothetical protein